MRILFTAIIGALSVCLLTGCATNEAALAASSQTHLDEESGYLNAAQSHLAEARKRLGAQADPHNAAAEIDAGNSEVQQAEQSNLAVRQDVGNLSDTAVSLRKEIDSHQNDLLGPRAKRIRNRLIVAAVLLSIGAAFLQVGPLLGGPFGGTVIVLGHLLTAFISPLLKAAWAGAIWLVGWIAGELTKLGNKAITPAPVNTPIQGASNAATGSD